MPIPIDRHPDLARIISDSSETAMHNFALSIGTNSDRWVASSNRYAFDPTTVLKNDIATSTVNAGQLGEYVAASVMPHLSDGWSYLAQATNALVDGDLHAAIHLSYYAELRAAMSLLAAQGIGVLNNANVWFDANGAANFFKGPTHPVTWQLLEAWANNPNKATEILNLITVSGFSIADWLDEFDRVLQGVAISALAADWLKAWSIDLAVLGSDHEIRNEASYNPSEISIAITRVDFRDVLSQIVSLWDACEPLGPGSFGLLDIHLLRQALDLTYTGRRSSSSNHKDYAIRINHLLTNLSVADSRTRKILLKQEQPAQHLLLERARNGYASSADVMGIYSRAFLLLRLSSASAADYLQKIGLGKTDLEFWWDDFGVRDGLWEAGSSPTDLIDSWIDVSDFLKAVRETLPQAVNRRDYEQNHERALRQVCRINRAMLWAVGI